MSRFRDWPGKAGDEQVDNKDMSEKQKLIALAALFAIATIAAAIAPPVPQDQSYMIFADTRSWMGIPNFGDVASNLGYLFVGAIGLLQLTGSSHRGLFDQPADRLPYIIVFFGVTCVAFGSSLFHWEPNNATLLWDRLPMAIAFMALFSAVIADRIDRRAGLALLPVLLLMGIGSVIYWHVTETMGQGDLRPYALVQFFPIVAIPLILWWFPAYRYTRPSTLLWVLVCYGAAKLLELSDGKIFELSGHIVSGHSLKHLVSALAAYLLVTMIAKTARLATEAGSTAGEHPVRQAPLS